MQLQRDLHEANLLTPTGKSAEIDLPLPQPTKGTVEHSSGRLVIHAPESLRVNPAKADGLRPVSFQEAMEGIVVGAAGRRLPRFGPCWPSCSPQEPVTLRLAAERRKPQVTIRQLLVARIDEGVIKYQATFFYSIHYSGVKSLRIDVPADVAPLLRNTTAGIHEKTIDPPPADLDKNMVAWSLTGEGELLGDGQIDLAWEKKLDKLDVGKALEVTVPRLVPRDVDRAWGQIVLAKAETLDFQEAEDHQGPAAHRPAARPDDARERGRAGLRVLRRMDAAGHHHPLRTGRSQADQHRSGRLPHGAHAGRRDRRAGRLPHPQRAAAADRATARRMPAPDTRSGPHQRPAGHLAERARATTWSCRC